ncbi:MAG: FecR domain-containing protein [Pseudomonadota bacterium]
MTDQNRKELIDEAADIFVRLREDPDNADILAERDAFLDRGTLEQDVYGHVIKAWSGAGRKPSANKPLVLTLFIGLIASAYLVADPLRTMLLADFNTQTEMREVNLASGDRATLDAGTSLADDSEGPDRRVALLKGTALFDVASDGRRFEVQVGDVTVEVLGTVFETAWIEELVVVSVSEGRVRASDGTQIWTLEAGESLFWNDQDGGDLVDVDPNALSLWRDDRLVADGLTFAQVADVIDRRLPGRVFIANNAVATSRVSGTLNLEDPQRALQALAATRGVRVITAPLIGHLILQ